MREVVAPRSPEPRLLEALEALFEALEIDARQELLLAFELRVLALVGLAPGLDACAPCGRAAPQGRSALFDPRAGSIVCTRCGGGPLKLGGALRAWMQAAQGRAFASAPALSAQELAAGRRALDAFLREHLDRPRRAAEVAAALRGLQGE